MKVIVACRLSRLHDGSTGLDSQEQETVRWAEHEGHEVVAVVQDAISGAKSILRRTRLKPWLTDPEHLARYDGIVVYRMDRLTGGDSAETRRIENWADSQGKRLFTADGLVFPCEGADGIRWDLAKRMAHDEWLRIQERFSRMQTHVRAKGGYIGRPMWGFMLAGVPKVLTPIDDLAPVVRGAFERVAAGHSLRDVSDWLAGETSQPWHERTLHRTIHNPVYEAIVGAELQQQAEAALARRRALGRSTVTAPKALLAALTCGNPQCDATGEKPSPMYRLNARGTLYYHCAGRGPRRKGCGNLVRLDVLDRLAHSAREFWADQPYTEQVFVQATENGAKVAALKARQPRSRAEADEIWAEIERLEAEGSRPARWESRETDMTVGEWLPTASLTEQRDFLAQQDIRAWHEGPEVFVTVNGWLAAVTRRQGQEKHRVESPWTAYEG